jgi:hypothetical protein
MAIRVVRLGTARHPKEGLRIGSAPAAAWRAQGGLCAARLLRRMAAGIVSKRAARIVGLLGTINAEALGRLRAALSARNESACGQADHRPASRIIESHELFCRLLLRRRKPLPPVGAKETLARRGRSVDLAVRCLRAPITEQKRLGMPRPKF